MIQPLLLNVYRSSSIAESAIEHAGEQHATADAASQPLARERPPVLLSAAEGTA